MSNFVGSRISLISKAGIRYEGTLVDINAAESTVALENVTSLGTESRPAPQPYPPSKTPYQFIKFRGSDIADLHVYEHPTPPVDPAIIEATRAPANAPTGQLSPGGPVGNSTFSNSFNSNYSQPNNFPSYTVGGPTPTNSLLEPSETADKAPQSSGSPAPETNESVPPNKPDRGPEGENRIDGGFNRGRNNGSGGRRDNTRRNSYNNRRHREGLPYTNKTLSFDNDFDFKTANAKLNKNELAEEFSKIMGKLTLGSDNSETEPERKPEPSEPTAVTAASNNDDACYDRAKSFFDTISCEALEKERGQRRRPPSWHQERSLNSETFGEGTVNYQRRNNYRSDNYRNNRSGGGGNSYGGNRDNYNNYHGGSRYNNFRGRSADHYNYRGNYRTNDYRTNGYRNEDGYNRRDDRDGNYRRDYNRDNRYGNYRNDYPRDRNFSNRDYYGDGSFRRERNDDGQGRSSYRRERAGRNNPGQQTAETS